MNPQPDMRRFRKYDRDHPNPKPLNMKDTIVSAACLSRDYCGTPGCHAGLFLIVFTPNEISKEKIS